LRRVDLPGNPHQPTLNQTIRLFLGVALARLWPVGEPLALVQA
jgi:hypothetical protein